MADVVDRAEEDEWRSAEVALGTVTDEQQDLAAVGRLLNESLTHIRFNGCVIWRLSMEFGARHRVVAVHRRRTELSFVLVQVNEQRSGVVVPRDATSLTARLALNARKTDGCKHLFAPVLRVGQKWHVGLAIDGTGNVMNAGCRHVEYLSNL